jgi:hypothetical protein
LEIDSDLINLDKSAIQEIKIAWGKKLREYTISSDKEDRYSSLNNKSSYDYVYDAREYETYGNRGDVSREIDSFPPNNKRKYGDNREMSGDGEDFRYTGNAAVENARAHKTEISRAGKLDGANYRGALGDIVENNGKDASMASKKDLNDEGLFNVNGIEGYDEDIYTDLSVSEVDSEEKLEMQHPNYMMCLYVKVDKNKFKWRVKLKQGFFNIGKSEYVFDSAQGDLTWC